IAVVLAGALSEGTGTGWFGFGTGADVVATRVVSGLYETGAGRLVFFVRGRVVNNGTKPRGPVRVVAELVSDEGTEARSETLAGVEPTPEDVYNLKSTAEAEKLARSLSRNDGERRIPPGGSLPFFTLIPEPPSDLNRHHLQVHLETIDAWTPPAQHADAPKTEAPKAEAPKVDAPPPVPVKVEAPPAKPDKKAKKGTK
ncbi:MAG: hypothetical protein JST92_09385, partial [Deltaproteobacteria bacterium]|nr:hypothetical protein [Deltaproteobacteria bacterium]